jgi:hypothetical protein
VRVADLGTQKEEQAEDSGPKFNVTLPMEPAARPEATSLDWINPVDLWMVNKPEDKACREYIDKMLTKQDKDATIFMAKANPLVFVFAFVFENYKAWRKRRK